MEKRLKTAVVREEESDSEKKGAVPHVVIVGAGFGGLRAARALRYAPVQMTVIDRSNHHLFQPLLYQVATADLSPADIAALPHGKSNLAILFVLEKNQQDGTYWVRRLSQHQSDEELGSNYFDERDRHNTEKRLVRRLEKLGYHVELHPVAPAA